MDRIFYLVIDAGAKARFKSFKDQYCLFGLVEDAVDWAKSLGWRDDFGFGINKTPGAANVYQAGDINLTILPLVLYQTPL